MIHIIKECIGSRLPANWHPGEPLPKFCKARKFEKYSVIRFNPSGKWGNKNNSYIKEEVVLKEL